MMIHKCIILLILMIILLSCTGCWDRRELEERIAVVSISIDRAEPSDEGQRMFLVSIQSPIPLKIAGGAEAVE
jgi:spore germination protein KC